MDLLAALLVREGDGNVVPARHGEHSEVLHGLLLGPHGQQVEPVAVTTANDTGPPAHSDEANMSDVERRDQTVPPAHPGPHAELLTMEEWEARYTPPQDARKSKAIPLPLRADYSKSVVQFYELCQRHGIVPEYTITEVASASFCAKVSFGEDVVEAGDMFPSKKEAKGKASKRALDVLKSRPLAERSRKRRSAEACKKDLPEENWISRLNEFCQERGLSAPQYKAYEVDTKVLQRKGMASNGRAYSCTVTSEAAPLELFGSDKTAFTTKADARRNAAKDAILWLRANGHMQHSDSPKKRRKSKPDKNEEESTQASVAAVGKTTQSVP